MSNTTTINSELISSLVAGAQYQAYEASMARTLAQVYDLPNGTGKTVTVPVWSAISAEVISDESAATAKDTNTTSVTLTLAEHVVYHKITNMLRDSASADVFGQLGEQSGRAIAESVDTQLFAAFAGFAEGGPGANVALTTTHIMKAAANLRAAKVTGPYFAVLNPKQAFAVKRELALNGGSTIPALSNVGNEVLSSGYIGTVSGVAVYESGLVAIDGSGDAVGAVFGPGALGHASRGTIDLQTQYQAAARATDLVLTGVTGAGILNAAHGVKITSDATFA